MKPALLSAVILLFIYACQAIGATPAPFPNWQNLALHKAVKLETSPNYPEVTDSEDARQLVDGKLAEKTPLWYDKQAVGWVGGQPVQFTIDLGKIEPIRGVALHTAAGISGVEWPAGVWIYVSDDGRKFSPAGDLMEVLSSHPPAGGYADFWLATDKLKTHGRYVKFICTATDKGGGAYVFLDEVAIYRGEDVWLNQPLVAVGAPDHWQADWSRIQWKDEARATPAAQRPTRLREVDGRQVSQKDGPLFEAFANKEGMHFTLQGEAGKSRLMTWTGKLDKSVSTENCRFVVLTFRATGIQRTYAPQSMVELRGFNALGGPGSAMLMELNLPLNDGQSHTLVTELPDGLTVNQIKVSLMTQDDAPRLTLQRLELFHEAPEIFTKEISRDASPAAAGFHTVDLSSVLNGTLADWYQQGLSKYKILLDGVRTLKAGRVIVSGVPFDIAAEDKNLAVMPQSHPSTERVEFLGEMVDKQFLEPQSRHDVLSVNVDAHAREAYLLLALSSPAVQRWGGQEYTPLQLNDIESLSVELTYDSGQAETAFPYSLADRATYIPARELGAYAVAVDPSRRLVKLTLHNRHYGPNFALAAVTLNTSNESLVPQLAQILPPQRTRVNPQPAAQEVSIVRNDQRITVKNQWYECELDLSQGFVIDKYVNRWNESAAFNLGKTAGLRVRVGDTIYTGRCFKTQIVSVTDRQVQLKLLSNRPELRLNVDVTISTNDSPELIFTARTTNTGAEPLAAELCLPALNNLQIGDLEQTRVFFPQYRTVDTGETIALRAPYGPEFTQQYMDIYSRQAGVGLIVRTHNAEQRMADFALRKDADGVSGGVHFPADYNETAAGESRQYIPVALVAHNGDWRGASVAQRAWIDTWYKPYRSQDKDYLLNGWEIACYRPSNEISWSDTKTPPNINAARTKWMTDEIFAFEKRAHGHLPDMVHFFNWTHNDKTGMNEYGIFGTPLAYEQVGGLDFFRKGIAHIQEDWGKPVSLYTVIDRFRVSALPDQDLATRLAKRAPVKQLDANDSSSGLRASDQPDGIYYIAPGDPDWLDFTLGDLIKMQRDTDCKMVYIDVFSTWSHAIKPYPGSSPRLVDLTVLKHLKEKLPADVAVWSEYAPTDYATQWEDGALQYYFLHLNEVFARRYNYADQSHSLYREMPMNIARFILPRFKSVGLTAYIEVCNNPSQADAMFINGDANQEDTWRLHHSRIREKLDRAFDLKHEYNDCFNSDHPSPHVDTAVEGIVANLFPGGSRNLWTVYNARPQTYSGVVLEVPHHPGAVYRDAWNGREITPAIEGGIAKLSLTIDPQQPGCIVQEWK